MPRRRVCEVCRTPLVQPTTGRPRQFCSSACKQRGWKRRNRRRVNRDAWWTPADLRRIILDRWDVTVDLAGCAQSRLVDSYLGPDHPAADRRDSLSALVSWTDLIGDGVGYLNPPYTPLQTLEAFLAKAAETAAGGATVVGLLPASVCARWWFTYVDGAGATWEALPGRVSYSGPFSQGRTPRWGSALVMWGAAQG